MRQLALPLFVLAACGAPSRPAVQPAAVPATSIPAKPAGFDALANKVLDDMLVRRALPGDDSPIF